MYRKRKLATSSARSWTARSRGAQPACGMAEPAKVGVTTRVAVGVSVLHSGLKLHMYMCMCVYAYHCMSPLWGCCGVGHS